MRRLAAAVLLTSAVGMPAAWAQDPRSDIVTPGVFRNSPAFRDAQAKGRAEAEAELKTGRATLYTYGLRTSFENLDRETGLPFKAIAGCVIDDTITGRADGHNTRILEALKGKNPPRSLKPWLKDLDDLAGFVKRQAADAPKATVTVGGPAATAPGGKETLKLVSIPVKGQDGRAAELVGVELAPGAADSLIFLPPGNRSAEVVWGPKGSGFAVLVTTQGGPKYQAIDLFSGAWLRSE